MEVFVFPRVEIDSDWNTLHHLHVISSRILRWEETKARARGAADSRNRAPVGAAVCIHTESHMLAGFHPAELCLLEIGDDPNILQLNQRHQLLPRGYVLPYLDRLLADYAGHRR